MFRIKSTGYLSNMEVLNKILTKRMYVNIAKILVGFLPGM